jgi:hypothetical protein
MKRILSLAIFLPCACMALLQAQAGGEAPRPEGFSAAGGVERYGPPEQRLADGTIFDYMDGGGIVYVEHGFRELTHREFVDVAGKRITCDCFLMASPEQALAALADERIASPGGTAAALAAPHKAYRFAPDYFIYLAAGPRLIYIHVDDDSLAAVLDRFAAAVLQSLEEEKK